MIDMSRAFRVSPAEATKHEAAIGRDKQRTHRAESTRTTSVDESILSYLRRRGPASTAGIAGSHGMTVHNARYRLNALRDCGLVARIEGKPIMWRVP